MVSWLSRMSPHPVAPLPFDGPFTVGQAREAGVSNRSLQCRAERGEIVRLRQGVYAPPRALTDRERIHAGLLTAPANAVLGFEAAAVLLEIPIPHSRGLQRVDLYIADGTPPGGARPEPEVRLHYVPLPPAQVTKVDGVTVTSLARTAIDVSRGQPPERAVIALDFARRRGVPKRDLIDARRSIRGMRGAAAVDVAIDECSAFAESPMESMSRVVLVRAGIARPVLQQELMGASGKVFRVDFFWPEARLVGEADGWGKYGGDAAALRREKQREDDLRLAGYGFVRWTWDELVRTPAVVVARVRHALSLSGRALPVQRISRAKR